VSSAIQACIIADEDGIAAEVLHGGHINAFIVNVGSSSDIAMIPLRCSEVHACHACEP